MTEEERLIERELRDTSRELERYRLSNDSVRLTGVELGRGSFTSVVEVEYKGLKCAGKRLHTILLQHYLYVKRYTQECRFHGRLRHPNIVHFLGVFYENPDPRTLPMLVEELLPTSLWNCIKQQGILPKQICHSILSDVSVGLNYLHNLAPPIMHRNLSTKSILLTSNFNAKISSLHMATPYVQHVQNLTKIPGNIIFMPPEAFIEHPNYDMTLDVFSFGVVMIHTFSGEVPVPSEKMSLKPDGSLRTLSEANRREKYLNIIGYDHPLMDLILQCISDHPQQRGNMSEILQLLKDATVHFASPFASKLDMLSRLEILDKIKTDLEAECARKDEEIEQEQRAFEQRITDSNAEHQHQLRALEQRMEKAMAESKALNQQLEEKRVLEQRMEKEMAQANAEHQQQLRTTEQRLEKATAQAEALNRQLEEQRASEQRMEKEMAEAKAQHREEIRILEQQTEKAMVQAEEKHKQERTVLEQRAEQAEAEAMTAHQKRQEAEIQVQSTRAALEEAESNIRSLLKSLDDAVTKRKDLEKTNTHLQQEQRLLTQRSVEAEAEAMAANQRKLEAERQTKTKEAALQEAENNICTLLQSVDDAETRLEDVTRQLKAANLRTVQESHQRAQPEHLSQENLMRGVEVCAETTLIVTNASQHFYWNGYGLLIHFPEGCLPADVEQCYVTIKASLAGQYEFPQDSHLVSAVYWIRCEPMCKFMKSIAVEIEHCAPLKNSKKLNIVRSHCTQEQLPYTFKRLGGSFSEHSSYASIQLDGFSGLSVAQDGSEEREYVARLYYLEKIRHNPEIHFVVVWDDEAHLTHLQTQYIEADGALKGSQYSFSFESDAISLDIPPEGIAVSDVWRIEPLTPLIVTKKKVDSFKPRRQIPCCQIQAILVQQIAEVDVERIPLVTHKVNLHGARQPFGFIRISLCIPSLKRTLPSAQLEHKDSQEDDKPRLNLLLKELTQIADIWEEIGILLEIDDGQLAAVKSDNPKSLSCLREMLRLWLKKQDPPPSWSAVIEAIRSLGNKSFAAELQQKYTLRIPLTPQK